MGLGPEDARRDFGKGDAHNEQATEAAVQTDESVEFPLPLLVPRPAVAFVSDVHPSACL